MFEYYNDLHQLVRVRANGQEYNVGRASAIADGLEILEDESPYDAAGAPREATRVGGRPAKPKVSVDEAAAKKKAAPRRTRAKAAPRAGAPKTSDADTAPEKADSSAADNQSPETKE